MPREWAAIGPFCVGTEPAEAQTMQQAAISKTTLNSWLQAVNSHLEVRREEVRAHPSPKRNRAREKARREARQLFAQYHANLAIQQYS